MFVASIPMAHGWFISPDILMVNDHIFLWNLDEPDTFFGGGIGAAANSRLGESLDPAAFFYHKWLVLTINLDGWIELLMVYKDYCICTYVYIYNIVGVYDDFNKGVAPIWAGLFHEGGSRVCLPRTLCLFSAPCSPSLRGNFNVIYSHS